MNLSNKSLQKQSKHNAQPKNQTTHWKKQITLWMQILPNPWQCYSKLGQGFGNSVFSLCFVLHCLGRLFLFCFDFSLGVALCSFGFLILLASSQPNGTVCVEAPLDLVEHVLASVVLLAAFLCNVLLMFLMIMLLTSSVCCQSCCWYLCCWCLPGAYKHNMYCCKHRSCTSTNTW